MVNLQCFSYFTAEARHQTKRCMDKIRFKLEFATNNGNNNREYEVNAIFNSAIYAQNANRDYLSGLYYLVF